MIKTRTVFILGAGASAPFGYPTGIELRNLICGKSRMASVIRALTPVNEDARWYLESVKKFIEAFSKSSLYSIDLFLENRKEYMNIGKMMIASYLIVHEKDERLREAQNNWYMYLYDRLKSSFEEFDANKISFITFNYDRSLEQFLFEALKNQFNKELRQCAEKLQNIPIIHLYGKLGLLDWQNREGFLYSYAGDNICRIIKAQKDIRLITEERQIEDSCEFQEAYKLIERSKRIYFLGFGFDETNLGRLNIDLMKNKEITATAFGLDESKQRWIKNYFRSTINTQVLLFELDALSLLRKKLEIE